MKQVSITFTYLCVYSFKWSSNNYLLPLIQALASFQSMLDTIICPHLRQLLGRDCGTSRHKQKYLRSKISLSARFILLTDLHDEEMYRLKGGSVEICPNFYILYVSKSYLKYLIHLFAFEDFPLSCVCTLMKSILEDALDVVSGEIPLMMGCTSPRTWVHNT